jgi:hypothetical protein
MHRRKFLSMLGIAPAVVKLAPLMKFIPETDRKYYLRKRDEVGPGGWVSYRFKYTVSIAPNTTFRMRYIE